MAILFVICFFTWFGTILSPCSSLNGAEKQIPFVDIQAQFMLFHIEKKTMDTITLSQFKSNNHIVFLSHVKQVLFCQG